MALEIAQHPGVEDGLPHFRYVGNLHGDEPTGRVLTLALAELLCESQRTESEAAKVLSSMHLWLLPTANPDGFDQRSRANRSVGPGLRAGAVGVSDEERGCYQRSLSTVFWG